MGASAARIAVRAPAPTVRTLGLANSRLANSPIERTELAVALASPNRSRRPERIYELLASVSCRPKPNQTLIYSVSVGGLPAEAAIDQCSTFRRCR